MASLRNFFNISHIVRKKNTHVSSGVTFFFHFICSRVSEYVVAIKIYFTSVFLVLFSKITNSLFPMGQITVTTCKLPYARSGDSAPTKSLPPVFFRFKKKQSIPIQHNSLLVAQQHCSPSGTSLALFHMSLPH